ncbi:hypothetical protein BT69DRAFT_15009 [Atractiella rhizophila]|nr:hypothetical protein BT69DRAFT_15009 [Atractiella rhizophila]
MINHSYKACMFIGAHHDQHSSIFALPIIHSPAMATPTPVWRSSRSNLGISPIDRSIYTEDSTPLPHRVSLSRSRPTCDSSPTPTYSATQWIASQNVQGNSGSPLILSDSEHSAAQIPVKEASLRIPKRSALPAGKERPQLCPKKKNDTSAAKKGKRKQRQHNTEEDASDEELVAGRKTTMVKPPKVRSWMEVHTRLNKIAA